MYKTYINPYYNPTDTTPKPGDNQNWEDIQRGFYRVHEAIEEGGSAQGVTMIKVNVITAGGAVTTQIANLEAVKSIIGDFRYHPQYVVVEHIGVAGEYDVYWPINVMSSGGVVRATYATIDRETKKIYTCDLNTLDDGENWVASVEHY